MNLVTCSYVPAGEGVVYDVEDEAGTAVIKLSPESSGFAAFSVLERSIPASSAVEMPALVLSDRAIFCADGSGTIRAGGESHVLAPGSLTYCGRGHAASVRSDGAPLRLVVTSFPPSPECRPSLLDDQDGTRRPVLRLPPTARRLLGVIKKEDSLPAGVIQGPVLHCGPGEGASFWQPAPTTGFVTAMIAPFNSPVYHASHAVQLLEPGARVLEHAHRETDEVLIAVRGSARLKLDGRELPFEDGTVAVIGRGVMHCFENAGADAFLAYAIVCPAGVESALREVGHPRVAGEPRPPGIVRDTRTRAILTDKYGFIFPAQAS